MFMSIRSCRRLPVLLFAFVLSFGPISSFSFSPRRLWLWTPLQAHDKVGVAGAEGGDDAPGPRPSDPTPYKFGDLTRRSSREIGLGITSVVSSTASGVEDVVRSMTGNDGYRFGDLTKKVMGSTTNGIEGVVQSVTGNEEYKFGDITKGTMHTAGGVITYSKKSLGLMRDANIHELVALMNIYWTKTMNREERREASVVVLYFGATVVLAYNFVANAMAGMVFAAAWSNVSRTTGVSPLAQGTWSKFLESKAVLDMFFGGPCAAVRLALTVPWYFCYRKLVVRLAYHSPLREKYPVANRLVSVIASFLVANVAAVGGGTFLLVKILSLWTGVPVFPVAP